MGAAIFLLATLGVSQADVIAVNILEIDQLHPVDIGHTVPTGEMSVNEVDALNLFVWSRTVTRAAIQAVNSAPSPHSADDCAVIVASIEGSIDPDLTAHVCVVNDSGSCQITLGEAEDLNRYLDMHLFSHNGQTLRVVVAEDAAKVLDLPVNYPVSFNVIFDALRVNGSPLGRDYIGRNLAQDDANRAIDAEGLAWANSDLINVVIATVQDWEWTCTPRRGAEDFLSSVPRLGSEDFVTTVQQNILAFLDTVPGKWSLDFQTSIGQPQNGIAFEIQYGLCGHLMFVPAAIQSVSEEPIFA